MILKRNEQHLPALLNYADVAGRLGKHQDSVSILLRCIVTDQTNKEAMKLLGREVGRPDGLESVLKNLPIARDTAPAYAFLATILRDEVRVSESRRTSQCTIRPTLYCSSLRSSQGHVQRNVDLLKLAHEAFPENCSYALNYFHSLELVGKYEEAFSFAKEFLKSQRTHEDLAKQVYNTIQGETSVFGKEEGGAAKETCTRVAYKVETSSVRSHVVVDGQDLGDLPKTAPSRDRVAYSADTLDLMAIFFTLVKILYHCGNLAVLPDIVKVRACESRTSLRC